ncbi:MAG: VWA domain-containing protein, partial [Gammaproteobacteria bacterium]|nr:VWA domain-containing protein [Gammaproteobacteria bacterium]
MPEQFHFLQPLWLLSLIPLALLVWRLRRAATGDNPWVRIIDARLQPLLLAGQDHKVSRSLLWLLGLGWLLATLALANPVWEKQPQPLYQTSAARVIVLDLSRSMLDRDLKPSRLARARFKIEDILARNDEGQTGLVVFAGDAFTVTPLTRDVDTIRALLKSLDPDLMPVQGSRADLGLEKAGELLQQAGLRNGQILLFADGVTGNKARKAATKLRKKGYRVSVLGVGTQTADPLTNAQGQLLRTTADGKLIVPQLETAALQAVAEAGGGRYRTFNSSDSDIRSLLDNNASLSTENNLINGEMQGQDWKDNGPWLALLLLPLAALAFRRGWLLSLVLL